MSRHLPDPSVAAADLSPAADAALAAARRAQAPLFALSYPPTVPRACWLVSVLETDTGDVRFDFPVFGGAWDRVLAERELRRRGYDSLPGLLDREWTELSDKGLSAYLFPRPQDDDHLVQTDR